VSDDLRVYNAAGSRRVLVTTGLPGRHWLDTLVRAGLRVEVGDGERPPGAAAVVAALAQPCDGVIGRLADHWDAELLGALAAAGGSVLANYAVGYDNIDIAAATALGIAVGNTPGVLTESTAEMAVALTFAAARRVVEAARYLADGRYTGWMPSLFLGELLRGKTLGLVGPGRIGAAYARMMVAGHHLHLVYYGRQANGELERYVADYAAFLVAHNEEPVTCRRAATLEELLQVADVVSLHVPLSEATHHLLGADRLGLMKEEAILVNSSRGKLIDEAALVAHCRAHPRFRAGLDVFENEPALAPGLSELPNVVAVPHLGSATGWAREAMATLAAANVVAILAGWPVWQSDDLSPFVGDDPPHAAPSIVNAAELRLPLFAASVT
jgi:glycerate dehydrogenase